MEQASLKPVAIVGGGITALTAAFHLKRRGIPVHLFEASSRLGGVIRSVREDGYLAEYGPNSILETSPLIANFVEDLGLASRRVYANSQAKNRYIVRGQKPVLVPDSPAAMLTTPLFSVAAKLRLLAEPLVARHRGEAEESLAHFVRRRLGQEFLDYAIDPLVAGIYAGDPELLSVEHAFPKLHAVEQEYGSLIIGQVLGARKRKRRAERSKQDAPKFTFDEGLQVLVDTLGSHLSPHVDLSSRVARLEPLTGDWRCRVHEGNALSEAFGAVLLAVPSYALERLAIPGIEGVSALGQIYYPPVASVVLGFRRDQVSHPLDGFGVLVPKKERMNILGALFSSSLFPNRAPAGEVAITAFIGGSRAPWLVGDDQRALCELALQDLARILGIRGQPLYRHVAVYNRAIPQYNVGFGGQKKLMGMLERKAPGVFIAGHCRDGISLADSILAGQNAATRIQTYLKTPKVMDDVLRSAA